MILPSNILYDVVIITMTIMIVICDAILFSFLLSLENKRNKRVEIE